MTNRDKARGFLLQATFYWTDPNDLDVLEQILNEAEARGRAAGLEEAAKEADRIAGDPVNFGDRYLRRAAATVGLILRGMKDKNLFDNKPQ